MQDWDATNHWKPGDIVSHKPVGLRTLCIVCGKETLLGSRCAHCGWTNHAILHREVQPGSMIIRARRETVATELLKRALDEIHRPGHLMLIEDIEAFLSQEA